MANNKRVITLGLDYSQIDAGTAEVNRKMGLLEAQFKLIKEQIKAYGSEADELTIKQDKLTQQIILQTKKVDSAKDAYEKALQSGTATNKQLDTLHKAYITSQTALQKLNNELAENKAKLDQLALSEADRKMAIIEQEFQLASEKARLFADETEQLTLKSNMLSEKIAYQAEKVRITKEAYEEAKRSGEVSEKQLDELYSEYLKNETALQKLNNELEENKQQLDEANKSAESFGDTIRGFASSLGLEVSPAVEKVASKLDGLNKDVGAAVLGIGAIIGTLVSFSIEAAHTADDILTLSTVTGIATDELQKMQYASAFLDVEVETMTGAMTKLTRNMYQAREGTKQQEEAFAKLHIRYKDTNGQLRDINEVFYEVIDALGKVKNETERDALAMTLMGRSAKELNPLIEAGSQRLRELGVEAEKMGVILSEDELDKLGQFQDAMDRLQNTTDALKNKLGLALIPILTALFDTISKIPVPVLQTLVVLASVIASIALVVKAIKSVTDTASSIKEMLDTVTGKSAKTVAAILGIVAALIALAAIIAVIMNKSSELDRTITNIGNTVGQVTQTVYQTPQNTARAIGYAHGTRFSESGEVWAGEAGPELIRLPRGSQVYTTAESKAMMGGNTYINVVVPVDDLTQINDVVRWANNLKQKYRQGAIDIG